MKILLALKTEYKSATGKEWKPDQPPAAAPSTTSSTTDAGKLNEQIVDMGNKVRELKSAKAGKVCQYTSNSVLFFFCGKGDVGCSVAVIL